MIELDSDTKDREGEDQIAFLPMANRARRFDDESGHAGKSGDKNFRSATKPINVREKSFDESRETAKMLFSSECLESPTCKAEISWTIDARLECQNCRASGCSDNPKFELETERHSENTCNFSKRSGNVLRRLIRPRTMSLLFVMCLILQTTRPTSASVTTGNYIRIFSTFIDSQNTQDSSDPCRPQEYHELLSQPAKTCKRIFCQSINIRT